MTRDIVRGWWTLLWSSKAQTQLVAGWKKTSDILLGPVFRLDLLTYLDMIYGFV
jgi:hypothetical protein